LRVGEEGSVDDVGQASLEGAGGFGAGVARREAALEVGAFGGWQRFWVTAMRWMAALS
jgi:hypothetical protein